MHQLLPNLVFGDESLCVNDTCDAVAVVHACKDPCHRRALGYSGRSLPVNHPHYLVYETAQHLFLNLIDPPQPLFMMPSFEAFFRFVDRHITERTVVIHCNQGESRAPSLALLYGAKRTDRFPKGTYEEARLAFSAEYPYQPGTGIQRWLSQHWEELG